MSYVTKEGLDKMKSELEHLIVCYPKSHKQIADARDGGDLSENCSMSRCAKWKHKRNVGNENFKLRLYCQF